MEPDPKTDFPILVKYCTELVSITDALLSQKIKYREDDHFAFMTVAFADRQLIHMRTILVLAREKCFPDSNAIARQMIEGMAILLWAEQKPAKRALRWKVHVLISDYNLVLEKEKSWKEVKPEIKASLKAQLEVYGEEYLKKDKSLEIDFKDDIFRSKWRFGDDGKNIEFKVLLENISGGNLYGIYNEMCDWLHWNSRGIGIYLKRNTSGISFCWEDCGTITRALACGYQALFQTLEVLNRYFKLGAERQLKEISDKYMGDISKNMYDQ
jgi:hypothetical protein